MLTLQTLHLMHVVKGVLDFCPRMARRSLAEKVGLNVKIYIDAALIGDVIYTRGHGCIEFVLRGNASR